MAVKTKLQIGLEDVVVRNAELETMLDEREAAKKAVSEYRKEDKVKRWFLTVDWCNKGNRGIFCSKNGNAFPKDSPHTENDFWDTLDCFGVILNPESTELSEDELKQYSRFVPLSEFSNQYGVALKKA